MNKFGSRALSLVLMLVMLLGIMPTVLPMAVSAETTSGTAEKVTVTTGASGVKHFFKEDTYYAMQEKVNTPLTYEFDLYAPKTLGDGRQGVIVGNYGKGSTRCVNIELHEKGKIGVYVNNLNGKAGWTLFTPDVRNNSWQHIAITINPDTHTATLYVNGVLTDTQVNTTYLTRLPAASDFLFPFHIGADARQTQGSAATPFKGAINSVALFSDIRSAEEIAQDAKAAKTWSADTDNLVAAYDISKQGQSALRDWSGKGRTLTYTNGSGMLIENFGSYNIEQKLEANPETVEAWVWFPKGYRDRGGTFFGNNGASSSTADIAFEVEYDGHPRMFYTTPDGTTAIHEFTSVDVRTGTWQHVAIVHDAANGEARCYLNGTLAQTLAYTESVTTGNKQTPVYEYASNLNDEYYVLGGDRQGGYLQYFKGFIKELRVYSDVRTASEIAADYAGNLDTADESLLAAYQMSQENAYKDIADLSGNGYTAKYNQLLWDTHEPIKDYAYSFAVVGDTQTVANHNADKLKNIYQWIIDNKDEKNIQYVLGLGDITEKGEDWGHTNNDTEAETAVGDAQWAAALEAISMMDGKLPYSLIRGAGHDGVERFNEWFGTHEGYTSQIDGYYKEGRIENTYHTFKVGDVNYMILCLDFGAKDDVLAWADEVVAAHPTHRVIVTTHAYMKKDGTLLDSDDAGRPSSSGYDTSNNDGDDIWNKFVRKHANIFMVMCGHMTADDVIVSKQIGDYGNEVTQLMINPQSMDSSSSPKGMVAMLYFSEDGEDVQVEYYSTITDMWRPNKEFTVSYGSTEAPSYEGLSEKYVIAQNSENGLYTVIENTYFQFLGGSLRYGDAVEGYTNIRFGYQFAATVDLNATNWRWNYGVKGDKLASFIAGSNKTANNITNLVITGVPEEYYTSDMEAQLVFDVVIDGVTYTVTDRVRARSVLGVAQGMVRNPNESQTAKDYAQKVINACAS